MHFLIGLDFCGLTFALDAETWSAIALWVTAGILAGSLRFAWLQVKAFREAERVKHTLTQLTNYRLSGSEALLSEYHRHQSLLKCADEAKTAVSFMAANDEKMQRQFLNELQKMHGYFDESNSFLERNIIDYELFIDNMYIVILMCYIVFRPIIIRIDAGSLEGFENIAKQAHKRYLASNRMNQEIRDYDFPKNETPMIKWKPLY